MKNDVYFSCSECGHTILTEMAFVGTTVDCPNCRKDVLVPAIQDGRNPRWRHGARLRRGGGMPPAAGMAGLHRRTDLVQKGLVSLERRQSLQVDKVEHLCNSLVLFSDQLGELEGWLARQPRPRRVEETPSRGGDSGEGDGEPDAACSPGSKRSGWQWMTVLSGGAVILGGLATAFYWLAP